MVQDQGSRRQESVDPLDHLCVLDCLLNMSLVPTLKLGTSLNYTRQRAKELSDDK